MVLPTKPFCIFSLFLVTLTIFKLTPQVKSSSDYTKLVYKGCAKQDLSDPSGVYSQALSSLFGSGFEERRDTVLSTLENGMASSNGFYTTSYQSVYALGQCEGDIGSSDCADCVKNAVQKAQVECGSSVSGQIFLHKCFISYSNSPGGVPKTSPSSSDWSPSSSSGLGQNVGRTVAIIVGGIAGVGFLLICLLFARNLMKKHDDY